MTKHPLLFNAYYLDFSYPGQFNAETRAFISIPCADQIINKNKEINILNICFEMNSVFNKDRYYDEKHNVDNGLKIMVEIEKLKLSSITEEKFIKKLKLQDSDVNELTIYDDEESLYKNLISKFENFLINSYSDNWINFYSKKRKEFNNKYKIDCLNIDVSANDERKKLDKFIIQSISRLQKILIDDLYDEKTTRKLNITYTNDTVLDQISKRFTTSGNTVNELSKIGKKISYFELKKELNHQNEIKQKIFKV